MKEITLVVADNFQEMNVGVIKKIDARNFAFKNLVIVPDRFSLLAEKLIFKTLDIKAYFNIEVMGISDLANLVFKKLGIQNEFVTKEESKILLRKAMKNLQGRLEFFRGKIGTGLIDMLYNSMSILQTNQISAEVLEENNTGLGLALTQKLKDLALIIVEYYRLLGDRYDGAKVLEKLGECIKDVDFSKHNLFFLGFDSFTKQGFEIMKLLAESANKVVAGASLGEGQKNAFIYEKDVYEKILAFANEKEINVVVEKVKSALSPEQTFLKNNLFALRPETTKMDFVEILEAENTESEIYAVAKKIKQLVAGRKVRYNQIAVAFADLEIQKDNIAKVFAEFGLKFYVDTEESFFETETIKFLCLVLKSLTIESDASDFRQIIDSTFSSLAENDKIEIFDFLDKYDIRNNILLGKIKNEKIFNVLSEIKNKFEKIIENNENYLKNNKKTINYYLNMLKNIISEFSLKERNEELVSLFSNTSLEKQEKIYMQIFDKLEKVLESFAKTFEDEEMLEDEFYEIFTTHLAQQKISTVPLTTDAVFVGDATSSFFEEVDYLFVVCANQNAIPRTLSDTAIVSDDVIEKLEGKVGISPTVRMVNRRNKFKVFDLLLRAKKRLFVSYHTGDNDGNKMFASAFVKSLEKMFGVQKINVKAMENNIFSPSAEEVDFDEFLYVLGNEKNAEDKLLRFRNFSATSPSDEIRVLQAYFNEKSKVLAFADNGKVEDFEELCFSSGKTKVSQIEKYYSCPFKHFSRYGLKLYEKDKAEVSLNDVGNFLHKVAEDFLNPRNNYLQILSEEKNNLNKIVEKIIKNTEKNAFFEKFLLKINKLSYNIVKKESFALCKYLYEVSKKTHFKTHFVEVYFGSEKFKPFKVNVQGKEFSLVGVVDRVDAFRDYFVAIDYKTGKTGNAGVSELFYGDKIQIFVYAKALENMIGKKPMGLFYFPISNEFEDVDVNPYKMHGKYVRDEDFLKVYDHTLNEKNRESTFFSCSLTSKLEYAKNNTLTSEELDFVLDYAVKMVEGAIEDILQGDISTSPRENACNSCPYSAICQKPQNASERKNAYKLPVGYDKFVELGVGAQKEGKGEDDE